MALREHFMALFGVGAALGVFSALRFYAGVPIRLDDGSHPGTLCVVDFQPRELSEHQREALVRLADAAAEALMMRERAMAAQA